MQTFEQQRLLSKRNEKIEVCLLVVVLAFLTIWFVIAGIHKDPEALRYQYDIHAKFGYPEKQSPYQQVGELNKNGTIINGQLSQLCGQQWYADFYSKKNRGNRVEFLESCQLTDQQLTNALEQANGRLSTIDGQIKTKLNYFISEESKIIKKGHTVRKAGEKIEKDYFMDSLSLQPNGNAEPIKQMQTYVKEMGDSSQPNYKAMVLATVASVEGDSAFPYNALFKDDATRATKYNETAGFMRKVAYINTDWANKAEKTMQIINPAGKGIIFFGIMALATYISLVISRRIKDPTLLLLGIFSFWMLFGYGFISQITDISIKSIFWVAFVVMALLLANIKNIKNMPRIRYAPASRFGYPLFVLFLGISWVILMDLSVRAHVDNRFLVFNHYRALFWAFFWVSLIPTISVLLGYICSQLLAGLMLFIFWEKNKIKILQIIVRIFIVMMLVLLLLVCIKIGLSSDNVKKYGNWITEASKLLLIIGVALILSIMRFIVGGRYLLSKKYLIALAVIFSTAIACLLAIREMGSLLVISFSITIFVGALLGYRNRKQGKSITGSALLTFIMMIVVVISVLLFGAIQSRTAQRIENWRNPFESTNDQLAIIHWLQDSAPIFGYSLGEIPWCGFADIRCYVPAQMQSDYTVTSLMLIFGQFGGGILLIIYSFWLLRLVKGHLQSHSGVIVVGDQYTIVQNFLIWSGVCWVVLTIVQMATTLAGNIGLIPLTGITLPVLSYGQTSLIISSIFIGLLINRPFAQSRSSAGNG